MDYKDLLERIIFEGVLMEDKDLNYINEFKLNSPLTKLILIFYSLKLNLNENEKEELKKEAFQFSKETTLIVEDYIKKGDLKRAKEITNIKNRTLNCFIEKGIFKAEKKEEKKGKIQKKRETIKEKKKKKFNLKFILILIPLILVFLFLSFGKNLGEKFGEENKKVDIKEYDFSTIIFSVKPITSFKENDNLYIIIRKDEVNKKEDLEKEIKEKLKGIGNTAILQDENGEIISIIKLN